MDLIMGLPVHPLINHVIAVLVPVSALGVILLIIFPKLISAYSPLILVTLLTSTVAGFIAENSGQALANRVGYPGDHAEQGERLSKVILIFTIVYLLWFLINKNITRLSRGKKSLVKGLKVLLILTALASGWLTFLVGHSGAAATWEDRIAASVAEPLPESNQPGNPSTGPSTGNPSTANITLSFAEVKKHNSKQDCWSIVNGKVYNLTSYVAKHPGGPGVISNICGKDGTNAFANQHGSSSKPNNTLDGFLLGNVDSTISQKQSVTVQPVPSSSAGGNSENGESLEDED